LTPTANQDHPGLIEMALSNPGILEKIQVESQLVTIIQELRSASKIAIILASEVIRARFPAVPDVSFAEEFHHKKQKELVLDAFAINSLKVLCTFIETESVESIEMILREARTFEKIRNIDDLFYVIVALKKANASALVPLLLRPEVFSKMDFRSVVLILEVTLKGIHSLLTPEFLVNIQTASDVELVINQLEKAEKSRRTELIRKVLTPEVLSKIRSRDESDLSTF
jgi:hypothetical protein